MGAKRYGSEARIATRVAERASSLIITRLSVLLMGTRVIATATWMRPSCRRLRNIDGVESGGIESRELEIGEMKEERRKMVAFFKCLSLE
jgi:hypothetical protein